VVYAFGWWFMLLVGGLSSQLLDYASGWWFLAKPFGLHSACVNQYEFW
jgi:hypothetical protein